MSDVDDKLKIFAALKQAEVELAQFKVADVIGTAHEPPKDPDSSRAYNAIREYRDRLEGELYKIDPDVETAYKRRMESYKKIGSNLTIRPTKSALSSQRRKLVRDFINATTGMTKTVLHTKAHVDHKDFYSWQRGDVPETSVYHERLMRVMSAK